MSSNIAKVMHEPQLKKWHSKEHLNAEIGEDCLKLLGKVFCGCRDYTWDKDEYTMYWVQAKGLTKFAWWCLGEFSNHPLECSNTSSTPCKQPGPVMCMAVGHPQPIPLWWTIAAARSFYIQQGNCDWHNVCHTPGARMVCSCSTFHSVKMSACRNIRVVSNNTGSEL